ncbi:MAG: bifunctional DNA primase/polymerase [Planctomycetaceae bacterium]
MTATATQYASARNAAADYLQRRMAPVPIPHGSKSPVINGWIDLRIASPEEFPNGRNNIGVILGQASSGLICVDLDDPTAVILAPRYLPQTGLIAGRSSEPFNHYFYRVSGPFKKREFKHKATSQKFIEILGDGQQVVVGPSVHPSGDTYSDLIGEPAGIDADELIDAVGRLFEAVCDAKGLDPYAGIPVDQPQKQVHQPGRITTGNTTRPGDDYNERGDVRDLLQKHGWKPGKVSGNREHWTRPGKQNGTSGTLTDGKVFYPFTSSSALESGRGYGPFSLFCHLEHNGDVSAAARDLASQGYGTQQVECMPNIDEIAGLPAAPIPKATIDEDLLNPGGLLQEIINFNLRTAIKPQPELALAGAIALCATIFGRKVQDDFGTRSNIYIVGISPSGSGKDHARRINKLLLADCGADAMFIDDLASDAGLHVGLGLSPALLLQLDEFGRFIAATGNPGKHPWMYKIITVLMKLYSSSGDVYKGPMYADASKNLTVYSPNCVLYGTTVPHSFFANLTTESLSDGFLNRLLVIESSNGDPDSQTPQPLEPPEMLMAVVRWWIQYSPGNLVNVVPAARRLVSTDGAVSVFMEMSQSVRERQRAEESRGTQIWGRCYENARKLALIHACSLDHEATEVTEVSAQWGCRLAMHLTKRIDRLAEEYVSDGEFDALVKKLLRFVRDGGESGRTRTEVCRHMRALNNRQIDEVVQKLVSTEEIASGTRPAKSGPGAVVYKAV